MTYSTLRSLAWLLPVGLLAWCSHNMAATVDSTAFYYGTPIPVARLAAYNRIVVEADNVVDLSALRFFGAKVFAYVSVGEAEGWRESSRNLQAELFRGDNFQWNSRVADLTQPDWKEYLLEGRMAPLWAQGYRGFFLDTLDSYKIAADTPLKQRAQADALVDIIRSMHQRFPGLELIFNRGFEVLPEVATLAVGLVAESLFQSWNARTQTYESVSGSDREWLLLHLQEARDRYGLPVTVIDYVAPDQAALARETARRIFSLGFYPWVATPTLDVVYNWGNP